MSIRPAPITAGHVAGCSPESPSAVHTEKNDKWWIYDNPAIFVLDQFRLAQVYEQLGNTDRARHWYERFLDDWKDADPDIPEVIEAQARLAAMVEEAGTEQAASP